MNYKSQLRGWGIDRAIEAKKAGVDVGNLMDYADTLVNYAYIPSEALDDHAKELFEMVRACEDPVAKCEQLISTLQYMIEQFQVNRKIAEPTHDRLQ